MKKAGISGGFVVLLAVLCFLPSVECGAGVSPSVTCVNPGDLQAAINSAGAAAAGAKVTLLVSGTCNENVTVPFPLFTLDGQTTATISAPTATSPAVTVAAPGVTVENFASISGGDTGVKVYNSASAVIENNTITGAGNASATHGVLVTNCASAYIAGNTITSYPDAGILVRENSSAHIGFIKDNDPSTFISNTIGGTSGSGNGIGVQVYMSSSAWIVGNTIEGNTGNGIEVDKVSQADIDGNTINSNGADGIYVSGNSGVNLGGGNQDNMFNSPNYTGTAAADKNTAYAVACDTGGYVGGYLGSLAGVKVPSTSFAGTCVNALTSTNTVVGDWIYYSSTPSGWLTYPTAITFYSDGTATATVSGAPQSLTWTLTGSTLKLTFSPTDTATGTLTWTGLNEVKYAFIETVITGGVKTKYTRTLTVTRQP
jgi:hypothetical protein